MPTKKATLTRDSIRQASDIIYEYVEVPEWGGTVRVKSLTGTERDAYEASLVQVVPSTGRRGGGTQVLPRMKDARARLVCLCLVDEEGNRLFGDDQVAELAAKSGKALDRVFEVGSRLSGLSDEDMQELEGN